MDTDYFRLVVKAPLFWLAILAFLKVVVLLRRSCLFGHDRKYLSIDKVWWGSGEIIEHCSDWTKPFHTPHWTKKTAKVWYACWSCRKCPALGQECLGYVVDYAYKIEHEKLVKDEKAWANWKELQK